MLPRFHRTMGFLLLIRAASRLAWLTAHLLFIFYPVVVPLSFLFHVLLKIGLIFFNVNGVALKCKTKDLRYHGVTISSF